jgi:hypothetical protein
VFKLKFPPVIISEISLVSFVDALILITFALYKFLLKFAFDPSLNAFILKVPPVIINLSFSCIHL